MGNYNCAAKKPKPKRQGIPTILKPTSKLNSSINLDNSYSKSPSILKVGGVDKSQTSTPYENGPFREILNSDNPENNSLFSDYPITPEYQSSHQSQTESSCYQVKLRTSQAPSLTRQLSLFSPDSENLSPVSNADEYGSAVYEFILKTFFTDNYPINPKIISEMIRRSLLSDEDAQSILSLKNEHQMSELFFSKFIFSETNISKLATFLFVLMKEQSLALEYMKNHKSLACLLIDHIYYVINFMTLIQNNASETESIKDSIYNSALISINNKKDRSSLIPNGGLDLNKFFFIRININEQFMSSRFWSIFSKINETFMCCQELIITSCNLSSNDVYNLVQGFRSSNILRLLDVSANPISDTGLRHIITLFQMKNDIETLNLTCCSLTHVGVEELLKALSQNIGKFHLQSLSLSHNDLENLSGNSVMIFTKLSLSILELEYTNIRCQKSLFESLKLNYSLKYLDISRNKLFNKDLAYLASGLAYNTNLQKISLASMGLTKSDCLTINNTFLMNKSLVSIDLSDNLLGDEGIKLLKDVLIMKKSLTEIILKRCGISTHGVLILLRQVAEPDCKLKLLDLCYNRCPRTSIVIESKELSRKILDILRQIELVKNIIILLWGTIDLSVSYYDHIGSPKIS